MSDNGQIAWTTETRKLGDLIPWEDNPRQLTEEQAERLERSLTKFGYSQLVEIEPDGMIVDGHQRDDLMKILPEFGPEAEIECRVSNRKLTLEERKELIALKHEGATGEWNWEGMHNLYEFDELIEFGFDVDQLEAYGFVPEEEELVPDSGAQVDRAEELREQWGVETGQLWRLGEHRLICGDCTDAEVVARVMDIQPRMMVTDPPYGVEYDPEWRVEAGANERTHGEKIENDDRPDWSDAWALFPGDVIYCWHAGAKSPIVAGSLERNGFVLLYLIIWNKDLAVFGRGDYHHKHEPCWYAVRKGKKHNFIADRKQKTVWEIPTIHSFENGRNEEEWGLVGHGTQKPIECMERPIRNHDFDVIYDPFLGSGTTLIACERLGRKCRAVEISPAYCAVAIQRWVDMTSGEPELINA